MTAVDGVSLAVRDGECLGLLGPNGAGKTTVIRGIVGRVIPDEGRISVFGYAAGSAEAREALGWVPQELAIYPRLTCRENLSSFGRYHGLAGSKLTEAVAWCLKWAALEDRAPSNATTRDTSDRRHKQRNRPEMRNATHVTPFNAHDGGIRRPTNPRRTGRNRV